MIKKFGTGKSINVMKKKEERKLFIKKWMPVIMLCVGIALIMTGVLIEMGVI